MLRAIAIGNLGADAELKSSNGRDFITFRIAHSYDFTSTDGNSSSQVIWIDCISNNLEKVFPYLKRGTMVYVEGTLSLRVYSSKVDRCMKAGITLHVNNLQLVGGRVDLVPKEVINPYDGTVHKVTRKYMVTDMVGVIDPDKYGEMFDEKGNIYTLDTLGFIQPQSNPEKDN